MEEIDNIDQWDGDAEDLPAGAQLDEAGNIVSLPGPDAGDAVATRGIHLHRKPTPLSSMVLTTRSTEFLAQLSRLFSARLDGILEVLKSGEKEGTANDLGVWHAAISEGRNEGRYAELHGPAAGAAFFAGTHATRGSFIANVGSSWDEAMEAQHNIRRIHVGSHAYSGSVQTPDDADGGDAHIVLRPRTLAEKDAEFILHRRAFSNGLRDFGLYAWFNAKALEERSEGLDLYLQDVNSVMVAELWRDIFEYTENALEIRGGTLSATLELSSPEGVLHAEAIAHALRTYANGLTVNREGLMASGGNETSYKAALRSVSGICGKVGLCAVGPLGESEGAGEPSQKAIDQLVALKTSEKDLGYGTTQVSHAAYVKPVKKALKG